MQLNDNYKINHDSENTILVFSEMREGSKIENKKKVGTGIIKEFSESFYYPNLKTALIAFLSKTTQGVESAKKILDEIKKVELLILNIKSNEH